MRYAVRDEPCMTRLTTMAAMPASTALTCGDPSASAWSRTLHRGRNVADLRQCRSARRRIIEPSLRRSPSVCRFACRAFGKAL